MTKRLYCYSITTIPKICKIPTSSSFNIGAVFEQTTYIVKVYLHLLVNNELYVGWNSFFSNFLFLVNF